MALLIVVLTCLAPRLRHPILGTAPVDFRVYYSASLLVHTGEAAELYTGADTGVDPQKAIAAAGTPIDRAARAQGLTFVGLYVYPPLLADLLLPFTHLRLPAAEHLWLAVNGLFLFLTAALLTRLLRVRLLSATGGLILLSLLCFTPVLQCLHDGQVTIVLLLLWAAGMLLYAEDRPYACGAVFALATAIKLTPALVLIPFLIWRTWRVVGAFAVTLLCFALICLWIDTPHALVTYITRVMPAMSGSIPYYTNDSLAAATQRLLTAFKTGSVAASPEALPPSMVLGGRVASVCTLALVVALIARAGSILGKENRVIVLALLSLMAPILSPVSWFHAYVMAFPAFVLLWRDAVQEDARTIDAIALTALSLALGSAVSENLMPLLVYSERRSMLGACVQFGQLALAAAVVCYRLWQMGAGAKDRASTGQIAIGVQT